MLSIKHRLKSKSEFEDLFRKGRSLANDTLVMKYRMVSESGPKIGFSVGLKYSKRAVERNVAKRKLREAARLNISDISSQARIIFILNPKIKPEDLSFALLRDKMEDFAKGRSAARE